QNPPKLPPPRVEPAPPLPSEDVAAVSQKEPAGPPAWRWESPSPQGNTLRALWVVSPGNAYAAGDGGVLMRTRDNGKSWELLFGGTYQDLHALWGAEDILLAA